MDVKNVNVDITMHQLLVVFFQAWLTVLVLPLFVQRIIDSVYGMRMMQIYDENPDRNSVEAPEALVDDEMVGEVASRVQ